MPEAANNCFNLTRPHEARRRPSGRAGADDPLGFNLTRPHEARRKSLIVYWGDDQVSISRAHMRRDPMLPWLPRSGARVSISRAHMRRDLNGRAVAVTTAQVSISRAHMRRDQRGTTAATGVASGFNLTRPHEARPHGRRRAARCATVSISRAHMRRDKYNGGDRIVVNGFQSHAPT